MKVCPECGNKLKELEYRYAATFYIYERVFFDRGRLGSEEVEKKLIDVFEESFHCPECEEMITDDYDEAVEILKSNDE